MATPETFSFTVAIPTVVQVPRKLETHTDLQTMDYAAQAYIAIAERDNIEPTTFTVVAEALRDETPFTVLYTDEKGNYSARTLFPTSVSLTKDNHIAVKAYCTLRNQFKTFRLDRCSQAHHVTVPGEVP